MTVECLECGAAIMIPLEADEGDTVTCKKCGEAFVIVALHPIEIDYAEEPVQPDWDEDLDEELDEDWLGEEDLDDEEEW